MENEYSAGVQQQFDRCRDKYTLTYDGNIHFQEHYRQSYRLTVYYYRDENAHTHYALPEHYTSVNHDAYDGKRNGYYRKAVVTFGKQPVIKRLQQKIYGVIKKKPEYFIRNAARFKMMIEI